MPASSVREHCHHRESCNGRRTTFSADLQVLKQLLWRLGEWFDEMDAIIGNHDLRIQKKTGGEITLDMLIEDTPVQLGQYSYLYLFSPTKKEWTYVCHQFNYSKTSVRLAQNVWEVVTAPDGYDNDTGERIPDYDPVLHGLNRQKCNVVVTHTHVAQAGFSPDGAWNCIGMGCMRDQRRTKYTQARATKFPRWNNAFVLMHNGYFTPLTMHHTDWRAVLGEDYYRILASVEVGVVRPPEPFWTARLGKAADPASRPATPSWGSIARVA